MSNTHSSDLRKLMGKDSVEAWLKARRIRGDMVAEWDAQLRGRGCTYVEAKAQNPGRGTVVTIQVPHHGYGFEIYLDSAFRRLAMTAVREAIEAAKTREETARLVAQAWLERVSVLKSKVEADDEVTP